MEIESKDGGMKKRCIVNFHTPSLADTGSVIHQPGSHICIFHTFVSFKYSEEVYFFVNALIPSASAFANIAFLYPLFN